MINDIDLSAWTKVGEGGFGTTYINEKEPNIILKISHNSDGQIVDMSNEFYASRAVYELGVPTPEMIEMVRVGGGIGIKSEQIKNKKSLARMCGDNPADIDRLAARVAELVKQLHKIDASGKEWLPSNKAIMLEALAKTKILRGKKLNEVMAFVEGLDDSPKLLHGDLSLGNLIFSLPEEKPYWIDLGRAAHGVPMFDIGHLYLFCNIFSKQKRVHELTHMSEEQIVQFWNSFALAYNGSDGLEAFTTECKRFAALDVVLITYTHPVNWHQRLFLGLLAKSMFK
ncbi:MAG: phosphotransferase [Paludibacteraceae bacterium]|nr:phosphotransferase [Paludibacteraceae bacterium]